MDAFAATASAGAVLYNLLIMFTAAKVMDVKAMPDSFVKQIFKK